MKKSTKWIIGLLVGVFVVVIILCLGSVAWRFWGGGGWDYGMHGGRMWGDGRDLPRQFNPQMMTRPGFGMYWGRFGGFGPLRVIGAAFLCLGIPALFILGVILLINSLRKPKQQVPTQPAAAPMTASGTQASVETNVVETKPCNNCGRQVQADWSHCPYCGNNL